MCRIVTVFLDGRGKCMSRILVSAICLVALFVPASLVAAEEPAVEVISGKVTDDAGAPLVSVKVSLYEIRREMLTFSVALVESVTTGPTGEFSFERTLGESTPVKMAIPVVLAAKEGLAVDWSTLAPGVSRECHLVPGRPSVLAGRVLNEAGEPVEGADVRALLMKGAMSDEQFIFGLDDMKELAATSGADGRFEFDNIPEGASAGLVVTAPGMAKASTFKPSGEGLPHKAGATDVEVTLSKEAVVDGAVVDKESGKGVAGVNIIVGPGQLRSPFEFAVVASDETGAFRAEGLSPGTITLQLMPPYGGTADWVASPVTVDVKPGESAAGVKVELEKGGLLEVSVVNERTGEPAENVSVTIQGADGDRQGVQTGAAGTGTVRLVPGEYTLRSAGGGEYSHEQLNEVVDVKSGETARVYVSVKGGFEVAGAVLDDSGAPLEGATVRVCPTGGSRPVKTDAAGKFRTTYNPDRFGPSTTARTYIVVRHPGRNLAAALQLEGADMPLTVKLAPAVNITGKVIEKVIEPGEKPLKGASITLMFNGENERWGSSIESTVRADDQGHYEIPAVPPDFSYTIYARAAGHGEARTRFILEAVAGAAFEADELSLDIADKSVSGTVVDEEGKGVAGFVVSGSGSNQPHVSTETDKDGAFRLEGLVEGVVYVSASNPPARDTYGGAQANAGDENVKVVISKRETGAVRTVAPVAPGEAPQFKGKPLPGLAGIAPDFAAKAKGKPVLVCFFDMSQRGGRRVVRQLEGKAETLSRKGIRVIAVDVSGSDAASVKAWTKQQSASFPIAAARDAEKARLDFGVKSLPWLILTDSEHIVRAEGFSVGQLEETTERVTAK
jgi:5-hydroxyisourate hydrolase-like protein (transthyretin family)